MATLKRKVTILEQVGEENKTLKQELAALRDENRALKVYGSVYGPVSKPPMVFEAAAAPAPPRAESPPVSPRTKRERGKADMDERVQKMMSESSGGGGRGASQSGSGGGGRGDTPRGR